MRTFTFLKACGFTAILAACGTLAPAVFAQPWQETKSDHFIVYTAGKDDPDDILYAAEKYYDHIASDLGYARHSEFWLWENRVKIYIYPDKAAYLKATNEPDWSEGVSDAATHMVASYSGSVRFRESVLPHELAHLILHDFLNLTAETPIPTWLNEGVAQWAESQGTKDELKNKARELYEKDSLLAVKDIVRFDIRYVHKDDKKIYWRQVQGHGGKWGVLVLSPDILINTFYIESGSLINFLIDTYGSLRFAQFCRELRDGETFDEAMDLVYGEYIHGIDDLDKKWRQSLEK